QLDCESLGDAFNREFGGAIKSPAGGGGQAAYRREVDDVAGALAAHVGKNGARDLEQAKDIHFVVAAHLVVGGFLDGAEQTGTGVVHEHVDAPELRDGVSGHRAGLRFIPDVEEGDFQARVVPELGRESFRPGARGGDDRVAGREDGAADFETEATSGAGN